MLLYQFPTFCPPLLSFFHPARFLIFIKISTLLIYSIPAWLFHPAGYFHRALLDYFFFIKKIYLHPVLSFCLFIFDLHLIVHTYKLDFQKLYPAQLSIFRKFPPCSFIPSLLDYYFSGKFPPCSFIPSCSIIKFQKKSSPCWFIPYCSFIRYLRVVSVVLFQ